MGEICADAVSVWRRCLPLKPCCSCCNQHSHMSFLCLAAKQVVMGMGQNRTNVVAASVRSGSGQLVPWVLLGPVIRLLPQQNDNASDAIRGIWLRSRWEPVYLYKLMPVSHWNYRRPMSLVGQRGVVLRLPAPVSCFTASIARIC